MLAPILLGVAVLVLAAGGAAWFLTRPPAGPEVASPGPATPARSLSPLGLAPPSPIDSPSAPPLLAVPTFPVRDRDAVLRWQPEVPTIVRVAEQAGVFLLAIPDLSTQGRMLNRVAALIEKARAPRDRVLTDRELAAVIAADNETADTYYYGHNYALTDLERFFALAAAGDIPLNAEERWLLAQMPLLRAASGGGLAALISLPNEEARFDAAARRAVFDHELGHGVFFTDPLYAAHVMNVWRTVFTEAERAAFRAFMAREGYDTANETLMANEAMAYFVCTPDRRFFDPRRDVGMEEPAAERLRAALRRPGG